MSTPRINYSAPFTRMVIASGVLSSAPFVLVDVGASGGIGQHWRVFEPHLHGFGFDPHVKECDRLNREERNKNVRYYDCYLNSGSNSVLLPREIENDPVKGWSNQPFERTSAARARKLQPICYDQGPNDDPEIIYSSNQISLDAFFADCPGQEIDFIKVDTDGHDYEVLAGAKKATQERGVLGFFVECQFHGITHPHANLFSNIDHFMRENGFSLFDMEIFRYTRGVLPGHFEWRIPAQTREGQVLWADVLFLRDVCAPGYDERWSITLSPAKLLKLACLFEIYGMPDCATELLLRKRDFFGSWFDLTDALNMLTREIEPSAPSFDYHNRRFESSPRDFYPKAPLEILRNYAPPVVRRLLSRLKRRVLALLN